MDLEEFERQVLTDEITDFESYFEQAENEDDIYIMQLSHITSARKNHLKQFWPETNSHHA